MTKVRQLINTNQVCSFKKCTSARSKRPTTTSRCKFVKATSSSTSMTKWSLSSLNASITLRTSLTSIASSPRLFLKQMRCLRSKLSKSKVPRRVLNQCPVQLTRFQNLKAQMWKKSALQRRLSDWSAPTRFMTKYHRVAATRQRLMKAPQKKRRLFKMKRMRMKGEACMATIVTTQDFLSQDSPLSEWCHPLLIISVECLSSLIRCTLFRWTVGNHTCHHILLPRDTVEECRCSVREVTLMSQDLSVLESESLEID